MLQFVSIAGCFEAFIARYVFCLVFHKIPAGKFHTASLSATKKFCHNTQSHVKFPPAYLKTLHLPHVFVVSAKSNVKLFQKLI